MTCFLVCRVSSFFSFLEEINVILGAIAPKGQTQVSVTVTYVVGILSSGLKKYALLKPPRAPRSGSRGLTTALASAPSSPGLSAAHKHSKAWIGIQKDSCWYKAEGFSQDTEARVPDNPMEHMVNGLLKWKEGKGFL